MRELTPGRLPKLFHAPYHPNGGLALPGWAVCLRVLICQSGGVRIKYILEQGLGLTHPGEAGYSGGCWAPVESETVRRWSSWPRSHRSCWRGPRVAVMEWLRAVPSRSATFPSSGPPQASRGLPAAPCGCSSFSHSLSGTEARVTPPQARALLGGHRGGGRSAGLAGCCAQNSLKKVECVKSFLLRS